MISRFSVKKPYTVFVAVIMVLVLGVVSFAKMSADLLPNISLPYVVVMTTYVGASPETVEMVVTEPIESAMATISNIENISSMSSENYSMVMLEFTQTANMDSISLEIRESLDQIKAYWNDSVGNPVIMKLNPNMLPVMIAAVGVDGMTDAEVSEYAQEKVIPRLESIEGVASANATGLLEETVQVLIRQEKIDAINEQVFGSIDKDLDEAQKEIDDGKAELADSEKEIQDNIQEIADSEQELADARQELADGKQELANSKAEMEANQQELEIQKKNATEKIAHGVKEINEKKRQLDDAVKKIEDYLTEQNMTVDEAIAFLNSSLEQAPEAMAQLEAMIPQMEATIAQLEAAIPQMKAGIPQLEGTVSTLEGAVSELETTIEQLEENLNQIDYLDAELASVEGKLTELNAIAVDENNYLGIAQKYEIEAELDAFGTDAEKAAHVAAYVTNKIAEAESEKSAIDEQLAPLKAQQSDMETKLDEAKPLLDNRRLELDTAKAELKKLNDEYSAADEGLTKTKEGLKSAKDNLANMQQLPELLTGLEMYKNKDALYVQIEEGMGALTEAQIEAASKFGSADAMLTMGKQQIESAESQLEASEEQITSGQEQIDSAKEQITSAYEQIDDAKEQLEDAQKQLDDSREMAYSNADMNGILTVETVKSLLTAQNFAMPAGYVTEDGTQYLIRVGDKPDDVEKLKAMPLLNMNMEDVDIITLGDVADVFMTDNSADIYTNVNGAPGVMLQLQKQTGYSTGDVSDKIVAEFEQMQEEDEKLVLLTLMDQGIYIDLVMDSIFNNIILGGGLAILILILFLKDLRPTFIIAVSIPVSLVAAIVCMYFSGVTLNIISLSGLALGIGMLVDNSIVVIENIYRLRNEGVSMKEAATEGAKEVAGAIAASTLTTVCVFAPILFTEGIARQLFVDMGLTIGYSLLASLAIALTVVPAMASKVLRKVKKEKESGFFNTLSSIYGKSIGLVLKWKWIMIPVSLILFVFSAKLAISRGVAFMPSMDSTQITLTLEMPMDSKLAETAAISDEIIERIRIIEDVQDVGAMTGGDSMSTLTGGGSTNQVSMYVVLKEEKMHSAKEVGKMIEEATADIENVELTINTEAMDMSALTGSGVSIEVRGRDLDTLQEIAKEVAGIVETVEGTAEVSDGMAETTGELRVLVDRDKAIECGLTVAQVFQQINEKITEDTGSSELVTDTKNYNIIVIHQANANMGRKDIKNLEIEYTDKDDKKCKIPLAEIANFKEVEGLDAINRNQQTRYIAVTAQIAEGHNVGIVTEDVKEALKQYEMPKSQYIY